MCVPIVRLLLACRPGGDYAELRKEQEAVMRARLSGQGLDSFQLEPPSIFADMDVWTSLRSAAAGRELPVILQTWVFRIWFNQPLRA
jgi:hypothetical protein